MNPRLPLSGKRIVVTRSDEQSGGFVESLELLGASVLVVPTIKIEAASPSPEDLDRIRSFEEYDIMIFTSLNCVSGFLRIVGTIDRTSKMPNVIAIGRSTGKRLTENGIPVGFIPGKFSSAGMLEELETFYWKNKKVLIPTGNLSGNEIPDFVKSHGGFPDHIVVYITLPNDSLDPGLKSEVSAGNFNTVTFFSPSQVKNFVRIFGCSVLTGKKIAVIGPTTEKAAEAEGLHVDLIPSKSTTEDLIESLVEHAKIQ